MQLQLRKIIGAHIPGATGKVPRLARFLSYALSSASNPRRALQQNQARLADNPVRRPSWIAPLALLLAAVSLGANGVLLYKLRHPERMLAPALERVSARLGQSNATLRYTVRIPAGTPVGFDVPINQGYT